eukprot:GILJ01007301.1.p1 GENE.GILJ01007301.1~~GILJ01007301.1.p1  ORF type:complete len:700 (+),score=100.66 GILJ01007301.1:32-2131(+)
MRTVTLLLCVALVFFAANGVSVEPRKNHLLVSEPPSAIFSTASCEQISSAFAKYIDYGTNENAIRDLDVFDTLQRVASQDVDLRRVDLDTADSCTALAAWRTQLDEFFSIHDQRAVVDPKLNVAIIGAGPSGLASAAFLAAHSTRRPKSIQVFEMRLQFELDYNITIKDEFLRGDLQGLQTGMGPLLNGLGILYFQKLLASVQFGTDTRGSTYIVDGTRLRLDVLQRFMFLCLRHAGVQFSFGSRVSLGSRSFKSVYGGGVTIPIYMSLPSSLFTSSDINLLGSQHILEHAKLLLAKEFTVEQNALLDIQNGVVSLAVRSIKSFNAIVAASGSSAIESSQAFSLLNLDADDINSRISFSTPIFDRSQSSRHVAHCPPVGMLIQVKDGFCSDKLMDILTATKKPQFASEVYCPPARLTTEKDRKCFLNAPLPPLLGNYILARFRSPYLVQPDDHCPLTHQSSVYTWSAEEDDFHWSLVPPRNASNITRHIHPDSQPESIRRLYQTTIFQQSADLIIGQIIAQFNRDPKTTSDRWPKEIVDLMFDSYGEVMFLKKKFEPYQVASLIINKAQLWSSRLQMLTDANHTCAPFAVYNGPLRAAFFVVGDAARDSIPDEVSGANDGAWMSVRLAQAFESEFKTDDPRYLQTVTESFNTNVATPECDMIRSLHEKFEIEYYQSSCLDVNLRESFYSSRMPSNQINT